VPKIHTLVHRTYSFGLDRRFSTTSLDMLVDIFQSASSHGTNMLEGRISPKFSILPEAGPVVIKAYQRGGLISRINNDRYLKMGQIRSRREFDFLIASKKAGVRAPLPVAYASTGFPFYKTWLITREIKGHQSFVRICIEDWKKALDLIPEISSAMNRLIKHNIHHVDLHPGNILLDCNNEIYVIDFDKACYGSKDRAKLKRAYKYRWVRAVHKYKLPEAITALELE